MYIDVFRNAEGPSRKAKGHDFQEIAAPISSGGAAPPSPWPRK